jgi:hypothetical protein
VSASTNWEDVYRTQTARIAELEAENAGLKADRERILTRLREILHTFTLHFSEPWRVNKELSGDATPFSIESVARVNVAGEALRKARTKKQKEHAFLLRQIAVFIRTQEGIGAKARYDLYRLLEESTPQSGEGKR